LEAFITQRIEDWFGMRVLHPEDFGEVIHLNILEGGVIATPSTNLHLESFTSSTVVGADTSNEATRAPPSTVGVSGETAGVKLPSTNF
jgi:hypothetical protein